MTWKQWKEGHTIRYTEYECLNTRNIRSMKWDPTTLGSKRSINQSVWDTEEWVPTEKSGVYIIILCRIGIIGKVHLYSSTAFFSHSCNSIPCSPSIFIVSLAENSRALFGVRSWTKMTTLRRPNHGYEGYLRLHTYRISLVPQFYQPILCCRNIHYVDVWKINCSDCVELVSTWLWKLDSAYFKDGRLSGSTSVIWYKISSNSLSSPYMWEQKETLSLN